MPKRERPLLPVQLSTGQRFFCSTPEARQQLEFHQVYNRPSMIKNKEQVRREITRPIIMTGDVVNNRGSFSVDPPWKDY